MSPAGLLVGFFYPHKLKLSIVRCSGQVFVRIHIWGLPRNYGEHAAYGFELHGIKHTSVALALGSFAFIIGFDLPVVGDGATRSFGERGLYVVVSGL